MKKSSLVVNEKIDQDNRIDKILGFDADQVTVFEKKYSTFMNSALDAFVESEDDISSSDVYQNVVDTFKGKELDLFISQITCQALMSIVGEMQAKSDASTLVTMAIGKALGVDCGPDCDCDCDKDEDGETELKTDHVAVKGDA